MKQETAAFISLKLDASSRADLFHDIESSLSFSPV